jgi:hypothetical protein
MLTLPRQLFQQPGTHVHAQGHANRPGHLAFTCQDHRDHGNHVPRWRADVELEGSIEPEVCVELDGYIEVEQLVKLGQVNELSRRTSYVIQMTNQ